MSNRARMMDGYKMVLSAPDIDKLDIAAASLVKNSKLVPIEYLEFFDEAAPQYKTWLNKVK